MPLLEVKDLTVSFSVEGQRKPAVQDVSFVVEPGEILGVVGESGSGKSVTGMSIMRLVPQPPGTIEKGEIIYKAKTCSKNRSKSCAPSAAPRSESSFKSR